MKVKNCSNCGEAITSRDVYVNGRQYNSKNVCLLVTHKKCQGTFTMRKMEIGHLDDDGIAWMYLKAQEKYAGVRFLKLTKDWKKTSLKYARRMDGLLHVLKVRGVL